MKLLVSVSLVFLSCSLYAQMDFKQKLIEAVKDKENQEKAKELAKKGMEYFQGAKTEEATTPTISEPVATPTISKPKHKKK